VPPKRFAAGFTSSTALDPNANGIWGKIGTYQFEEPGNHIAGNALY